MRTTTFARFFLRGRVGAIAFAFAFDATRRARRRCALRFDLKVGTAFKKLTREVGRRGFG